MRFTSGHSSHKAVGRRRRRHAGNGKFNRSASTNSAVNQQTGPVNLKTPQHVGGNGRSLISRTPIWARVVVVLLLTLLASVTCVGTLYAASVSRMATDAQRVLTSAESLANSALGCGSDKSLSDISQELVNATNDLNAELNGPQWDFFRDHSRFGSDITAAREMLASGYRSQPVPQGNTHHTDQVL